MNLFSAKKSKTKSIESLRTIFFDSLSKYYQGEYNLWSVGRTHTPHELFPNTLGITGVVVLKTNNGDFAILEKYENKTVKGAYDLSFSKLINAAQWVSREIISVAMDEELLYKMDKLKSTPYSVSPVGLIYNQLYMFQPELCFCVIFNCGDLPIQELGDFDKHGYEIVRLDKLLTIFEKKSNKGHWITIN